MKSISIREFQLHAEQYLKELPITLTRYNVPVAVVSTDFVVESTYGETKNTPPSPPNKLDAFQKLKKQIETPKEMYDKGNYADDIPPSEELTYSKEDIG